jgi:hypothetical protein
LNLQYKKIPKFPPIFVVKETTNFVEQKQLCTQAKADSSGDKKPVSCMQKTLYGQ